MKGKKNPYGYTGIQFDWGFHQALMFGILHNYRMFAIALGPFFMEWTW